MTVQTGFLQKELGFSLLQEKNSLNLLFGIPLPPNLLGAMGRNCYALVLEEIF